MISTHSFLSFSQQSLLMGFERISKEKQPQSNNHAAHERLDSELLKKK